MIRTQTSRAVIDRVEKVAKDRAQPPQQVQASRTCKWCCKCAVREHTSLVASVFSQDYKVPANLGAETQELRNETNSIRAAAGSKSARQVKTTAKLAYIDPPVSRRPASLGGRACASSAGGATGGGACNSIPHFPVGRRGHCAHCYPFALADPDSSSQQDVTRASTAGASVQTPRQQDQSLSQPSQPGQPSGPSQSAPPGPPQLELDLGDWRSCAARSAVGPTTAVIRVITASEGAQSEWRLAQCAWRPLPASPFQKPIKNDA